MSERADLAPAVQVEHCITCGDEAVPMRVLAVDVDRGLALCERADGGCEPVDGGCEPTDGGDMPAGRADRRRETVEIALVGALGLGETVLVHAGVALQRVHGAGRTEGAG